MFGNINITDGMEDAAYRVSFGDLPNKTVYKWYSPAWTDGKFSFAEVKAIDLARDAVEGKNLDKVETKALTTLGNIYATGTSYTATSGSLPVMIPIYLDPAITDITRFRTPLFNGLIKKVANKGLFADFNQLTAKTAAGFKAEDAALNDATDTYNRVTYPIKYAYAVGRITGPTIAGMAEFQNARDLEVNNRHIALAELLERQICQGTGYDSVGFSGFYDLVTTNTANLSAATITIAALRTAILTARQATTSRGLGNPDLIVTDYKTLDDIKALLQNELRYYNLPQGKIAWGIQAIEFEGIPIIVSSGMITTASSREVHVYDTSVTELRILQDETFQELANTNDSYKFMIKWYGCMVIKSEKFCYRIYGGA